MTRGMSTLLIIAATCAAHGDEGTGAGTGAGASYDPIWGPWLALRGKSCERLAATLLLASSERRTVPVSTDRRVPMSAERRTASAGRLMARWSGDHQAAFAAAAALSLLETRSTRDAARVAAAPATPEPSAAPKGRWAALCTWRHATGRVGCGSGERQAR